MSRSRDRRRVVRRAWIFALLLGVLGLVAAACGDAAGVATPTELPAAGQPQTATATPGAAVPSPTVALTPAMPTEPTGPTPTVEVMIPLDFEFAPGDALASSTRAIERATDYARQELGAQRVRAVRAMVFLSPREWEAVGIPAGTALWNVDLAGDRFRLLGCTAASPAPGTPVALCEGSSVQVTLRVADGAILSTWIFE